MSYFRLFYRDEHAVVLSRLAREPFLREDDLPTIFCLTMAQILRILTDLLNESMICREEVLERGTEAGHNVDVQIAKLIKRSRDYQRE